MRTRSRDNDPQRKAPDDDLTPTALPSIRKPSAGVHVRRTGRGVSDSNARQPQASGSQETVASTQDRVLGAWNEEGRLLNIYLRSGAKQTGCLAEWDLFSITLDVRGDIEWIQKKAILSIVPAAPGESKSANRRGRGHAV